MILTFFKSFLRAKLFKLHAKATAVLVFVCLLQMFADESPLPFVSHGFSFIFSFLLISLLFSLEEIKTFSCSYS